MKVFFVILHFGDIEITKRCIASLFAKETYSFSLIVVNNTKEKYSRKDFSKKNLVVINNQENLGFARGANVGIWYAQEKKADAICLLNNDTEIDKALLKNLLDVLEDRKIGIVGPAITFRKNGMRLFDIGGRVDKLFLRTSHEEVTRIRNKEPKEITYVSGCCMLIKKEVFQKIGYFDESFFLYYEDVDFCLRAKEKGFTTFVVPSALIGHALSASVGKMSTLAIYHLLRSGIYFGEKYAKSPIQKIANRLFILTQATLFFKVNPKAGVVIARAFLGSK